MEFSHASMAAELVVKTVKEKIITLQESHHAQRKEWIDCNCYVPYVRKVESINRIRRMFGLKPNIIVDSDTYYQQFKRESLKYFDVTGLGLDRIDMKYFCQIETLKEILAVAEAGMYGDGKVKLTSNHCRALGFGKPPLMAADKERVEAEQELEVFLSA